MMKVNRNKLIKIYCTNTQLEKEYPFGTTLQDIIDDQKINLEFPILGAIVNNKLKELDYLIYKPKTVYFIDYRHPDGKRMYMRSLSLVLFKAAQDLFPTEKLKVKYGVSNGIYCELGNFSTESRHKEVVDKLKQRMQEIIAMDMEFEREEMRTDEAIKIFEKFGLEDKCTLMRTRQQFYSSVYKLDGVVNYFYGYLIPSSGYLKKFDLIKYYDGMLLIPPSSTNPNKLKNIILLPKLFEIFRENKEWVDIIGVPNVGQLNEATLSGNISEIIKISEALQEKKLACIADRINKKKDDIKVVFISGPSSSGKTTFAKRLSIQLSVNGFKPQVVSMDNYFIDREFTPRDKNGDYDFESPYALNLKLFNEDVLKLINNEEIRVPHFSFTEGKTYYNGETMQMDRNGILIIEGIHGLNPIVSELIPENRKFKIYVSALTPVSIDSSNRIPTTDNRLLRRIVRDNLYRSYSALDTLKRWPSVRNGEEKHIFPFQEEADVMFNTALVFELGVLKQWAEPILQQVPPTEAEYSEARRLIKFLSYFLPIKETEIPPTSILREFLDGSSFHYS